jgi:hypothetical protein
MLLDIRRPQRLQSELDTGDDEINTTVSKKAKSDSKVPLVPPLYRDTYQEDVLETNEADEQNDNPILNPANEMDHQPIPSTSASSVMLDLNQLPDEQVFDEQGDQPAVDGERCNDQQALPFVGQSSQVSVSERAVTPTFGSCQSSSKGSVGAPSPEQSGTQISELCSSPSQDSLGASSPEQSGTQVSGLRQSSSQSSVGAASRQPSVTPTSGSRQSTSQSSVGSASRQPSVTPTSGSRQSTSQSSVGDASCWQLQSGTQHSSVGSVNALRLHSGPQTSSTNQLLSTSATNECKLISTSSKYVS